MLKETRFLATRDRRLHAIASLTPPDKKPGFCDIFCYSRPSL
ncbi:MAG: hypothetical protein AB4352_01300 [Hormoscilla sp.]